jgi:hypothetical protein
VLACVRNGLVDGPFAKRPRPGNQSTLPTSRVAPFSSPLHLSHPHPPKPPRLQALLVATLAAEPSAVSNSRADLTVHLQQAHARAPLHASGTTALQHHLHLVTAPSAVDVVPPQTSTAVLCSRWCLLARHWHRTLNPRSPAPTKFSLSPVDFYRSLSINDHRAHPSSPRVLDCIASEFRF